MDNQTISDVMTPFLMHSHVMFESKASGKVQGRPNPVDIYKWTALIELRRTL
jgi:hypothetical protein